MKLHISSMKESLLTGIGLLTLASAAFVAPAPDVTKLPNVPQVDPVKVWVTYCESTPNSTGLVSEMFLTGSLSIADNNTWIHSNACPPGEYGVFLFGQQPAELPWGNGVLCISPFYPGAARLNAPALVPVDGVSSLFLDMTALPPQMQVVAGSSCYFQCMFRDPTIGAGFNLSNAVKVNFGL